MSTNEMQKPLTQKDHKGQIGLDGFGQMMHYYERDGYSGCHIVEDVRGQTCELCGQKWKLTTASWIDQFLHSDFGVLLHQSCYLRYLGFKQKTDWFWALCDARLRFTKFDHLKNEYGGAWNTPWYRTRLPDHDAFLKLGRRKRVDVIELIRDDPYPELIGRIAGMFASEDVTKDTDNSTTFMIHSWSNEKSIEYLKKIAEALGDDGKPKGEWVAAPVQRFSLGK